MGSACAAQLAQDSVRYSRLSFPSSRMTVHHCAYPLPTAESG